MMNKKRILIASGAIIFIIALFWIFTSKKSQGDGDLFHAVKKGDFDVSITTTGELQARHSEEVNGPAAGLRAVSIWNVKISDLVAEGTIVQAGDYIATLDRTEVSSKLKDIESEVQKYESQFTQSKLDTSLTLRTAREDMINLGFAQEEKKIALSQSKFEPPAYIRQAEIDLDKAQRAYKQAKENYEIKKQQAIAKTEEVAASLSIQKNKRDLIVSLMDQLTVKAPKAGMVIYAKEWDGKKKAVGATISAWESTVATLPDLSQMDVKTYVNEIDISKIKKGLPVKISIDAFPNKSFTGVVTTVANVGEQRPNSDAKVFEVSIQLNEKDAIIRPSMTTSNIISASTVKNTLFVPLECIHNSDSLTYVFLKDGFSKRKIQVELGESNANSVVIKRGLKEGDILYLSMPSDTTGLKLEALTKTFASAKAVNP